jgi:hypothetical protein
VGERRVWYWLAIGRETLRSVWTVSKLRTHSAVTLTVIGRRVQVGEEIAAAKVGRKREVPEAELMAPQRKAHTQQQTADQRRQREWGGEAAVRKHCLAATGEAPSRAPAALL